MHDLSTHILEQLDDLTMFEGLTVMSASISCILHVLADVMKVDKKLLYALFFKALKSDLKE